MEVDLTASGPTASTYTIIVTTIGGSAHSKQNLTAHRHTHTHTERETRTLQHRYTDTHTHTHTERETRALQHTHTHMHTLQQSSKIALEN